MPVYLAALAAAHEYSGSSPPVCHQYQGSIPLCWQSIPSVICNCRAKLGLCPRLYQPPQGPPAPQRPMVDSVQPRVQCEYAAKILFFF